MILGFEAWLFWLALMIVFLVIEALTFNLTTIWFAVGCLAALILDLYQVSVRTQIIVMLAVSAVLLLLFNLTFKPRLNKQDQTIIPTGADRFIGAEAQVTETIDPALGTGLVAALGQIWSAVSDDGRIIAAGTLTTIVEIRGVQAVVRPQTADLERQEERT